MVDSTGARLTDIARDGLPRRGAGLSVDLDQRGLCTAGRDDLFRERFEQVTAPRRDRVWRR